MGRRCKVLDKWFGETDPNGYQYNQWLRKTDNPTVAYCGVCQSKINVFHTGLQAIQQHANGILHKKKANSTLEERQLRLTGATVQSTSANVEIPNVPAISNTLSLFCLKDGIVRAEILWCLKNVVSHMSASSCDDIGELFRIMFPSVSKQFSLNRTKMTYYLTEALGPYFHNLKLKDIEGAHYSLEFDETTNKESKKELQVRLRYWSKDETKIVSRHLQTYFIGTATAEVLLKHINKALDDNAINSAKMLMLSMDGPNVNKKVYRLLNEQIIENFQHSLLDLGSCDIHIVHNAFKRGVQEFGSDEEDLVIDLYYFFHGWPQRQEDFEQIQIEMEIPQHKFLKHINTRWLTLKESAERVIEQWNAIKKYFIHFIPLKRKSLLNNEKYRSICSALNDYTKAKLYFLINSANMFLKFVGFFQRREPLIHLLYDHLFDLVKILIMRVCKESIKIDDYTDLTSKNVFSNDNLKALKEIEVGSEAKKLIIGCKEIQQVTFYKSAQKHYKAAAEHLINKSSLKMGSLLKYFRFIDPTKIKNLSARYIIKVAEKLPFEVESGELSDEWHLLKLEPNIFEKLVSNINGISNIEFFWGHIFKIKLEDTVFKFPNITKIVKACLSLSHGSADVERGFSTSNNMVTYDKTALSVRTLNARLNVHDGMAKYNYKPHLYIVPQVLVDKAKSAHKSYQNYLEDQRKQNEEKEKLKMEEQNRRREEEERLKKVENDKETIGALENKLKKIRNDEKQKTKELNLLLKEGTDRLNKAVKAGDINGARVAQCLLDTYQSKKHSIKTDSAAAIDLERKINKRKNNLISDFIANKKTKLN